MVEKGAGVLKYEVIYSWVVKNIFDGVFPYKSKLPSEAQLMAQFSVSRQTVRNAMKKLAETGYIQSVRGSGSYVSRQTYGSSKKISVMFTTISGYICSDIFNGLESVLSKLGYSIQLELSHNSVDNETRFLKKMLKSNVAGIILEPTKSGFPTPNANLFHKLDEAGIPYVFVNSCYRNVKSNAVVWDDEKVSYHLTRHLIKSGHPNIGCFFASTRYRACCAIWAMSMPCGTATCRSTSTTSAGTASTMKTTSCFAMNPAWNTRSTNASRTVRR